MFQLLHETRQRLELINPKRILQESMSPIHLLVSESNIIFTHHSSLKAKLLFRRPLCLGERSGLRNPAR